jgi:hypothetical protein
MCGCVIISKNVQDMLAFLIYTEVGFKTYERAKNLSAYFNSIEDFTNLNKEQLKKEVYDKNNGKTNVNLDEKELEKIEKVAQSGLLDSGKSAKENHLRLLCRNFTRTQLSMVRELSLDDISPNPLLIMALNLTTPRDCIEFNVYSRISRSIVTSMGNFVEKVLASSSDRAELVPKEWDILKKTADGKKCWIQVKSGPNDMDKDQIDKWSEKIKKKTEEGDRCYIGITYGKRENNTVTLGLFRSYLEDWENKTLIGRELWDFVSEDPTYHEKLFDTLLECGTDVLGEESLCQEIEQCINKLTQEFVLKYGNGPEGIQKYMRDIF